MKPILFNTEMVRAILDGRKTVTRRVVKLDNHTVFKMACAYGLYYNNFSAENLPVHIVDWYAKTKAKAPYCKGDILYVRETWRMQNYGWIPEYRAYEGQELQYRADFTDEENEIYGRRGGCMPCKWHPSIHMPKEASRIFLRVTNVRVEQLQDITEEQARAEGFSCRDEFIQTFLHMYPDCTEESWVRVIEFERCEKPEE